MQIVRPATVQLIDTPLRVGENPLWDDRSGRLLFADIPAPALYAYDPGTGGVERWEMPATLGSFGLCADGRALLALRTGLHFFDFATGKLEFFVHPEPDKPTNRLNDGKVGPDGRFWVGSMDDSGALMPTAALYRVDPDGTCSKMAEDLIVSNGLAWSPDGLTLYHSDSRGRFLTAYDYDPQTGDISNRRLLRRFEEEDGRPDGAAMDAEGFYWSAGVSAGCLNRIAPDGEIVEKLHLPVPAPTMPCFGGEDLRTLYVTSLATDRTGTPIAGTLLRVEADVAGAPVGRFGARLPGL